MCLFEAFLVHIFIPSSFDSLEDSSSLVQKAEQTLRLTHYSRPLFESNVRQAYDILAAHKGSSTYTYSAIMNISLHILHYFPIGLCVLDSVLSLHMHLTYMHMLQNKFIHVLQVFYDPYLVCLFYKR